MHSPHSSGSSSKRTLSVRRRPLLALLVLVYSLSPQRRGADAMHLGGPMAEHVFGAQVTLTTTMSPQKAHPTGDRSGGGGGGFINQAGWLKGQQMRCRTGREHLKLLTMLTLAIYLKVDTVVLPSARSRDTLERAEPTWQVERSSTLWDVPSIEALLQRHNITLTLAASAGALAPGAVAPTDELADPPPPDALILPSYFCRVLEVEWLAGEVRRLARAHVAAYPARPTHLFLYAPDLILALRTDHLPLYAEVAAAVRFAPKLLSMSAAIAAKLHREAPHYNGLHLRVEGDFREVHNGTILDGLASYYDLIRELNFTSVPVYVASGIFVEGGRIDTERYGSVDGWFQDWVVGKGYASRVVNRRMVVHDVMARGKFRRLHSEQRAAVDFLVLLRSRRLIGTRMSSFSFLLQEYRALQGWPRSTTGTVGGAWGLFKLATGLAVKG